MLSKIITLSLWGIGAITTYGMSLVVTKSLAPKDAGAFFIFQTVIITVGMLASLGLNSFLPKLLGGCDKIENVRNQVVFIFYINIVLALTLGLFAVYALVSFSDGLFSLNRHGPILVFCILFHSLNCIISAFFQSVKRPNFSVFYLTILQQSVFCIIVIISAKESLNSVLNILLLSYVISTIVMQVHVIKSYKNSFLNKGFDNVKPVVNVIPYFFTILLLSIVINQLPMLLAGKLFSLVEVAALQIAIKLSAAAGIVVTAINTIVAPQFSFFSSRSKFDELKKVYVSSLGFVVLFTLPCILLFFLYSEEFMLYFGSEYGKYNLYLKLLLVGQVFNVVSGPSACFLTMVGNYNKVIIGNSVHSVFVIFGYFLANELDNSLVFIASMSLGLVLSNLYWV
ncbi:hypothetical protein D3729_25620, partial [Vibrio parahaemolyticus]|nr:hypothetical protein [Vibrio parahaemolyticus]